MSDLISRHAAIEHIEAEYQVYGDEYDARQILGDLEDLPSAQPEIIRCKDCKWWDKYGEKNGYCMAAKHGYYSSHWEISIRRTYGEDFFCADAEPIPDPYKEEER